jgi:hypothetical protein
MKDTLSLLPQPAQDWKKFLWRFQDFKVLSTRKRNLLSIKLVATQSMIQAVFLRSVQSDKQIYSLQINHTERPINHQMTVTIIRKLISNFSILTATIRR